MADQVFAVSSGFYDAVNSDRTYSADDMNRPYKRVVSNGVFATPQGTKSTDLQVVSANNGMQIIVQKGEGIFADKWFENPAAINITVPANTSTVPRIDSVIVQVDKRTSGRVGNIVYRTGTPSVNPTAPSINTVSNVTEYRLANVRVETGTTAITTAMITDRRGSSDCPWVTSLIYQVDTSVLYDQWAAAYEEYFEAEKSMWDDWYSHLTEELNVSLTLVKRTNTVITTQETSEVYIGISEYNANTDMLEVYINGMRAIDGSQYTINGSTSILLSTPLGVGQTVNFVVLKSVVMGNTDDIITLIDSLEDRIATIQGGNPTVVDTVSDMTDTDKIYILSTDSKWYYYNLSSSAWVAGGVYGGVPTDTTLTQAGMAADSKTVGDAINGLKTSTDESIDSLNNSLALVFSAGDLTFRKNLRVNVDISAGEYVLHVDSITSEDTDDQTSLIMFYYADESGNVAVQCDRNTTTQRVILLEKAVSRFFVFSSTNATTSTGKSATWYGVSIHKPISDKTLSIENHFADAAVTGNKIKKNEDAIGADLIEWNDGFYIDTSQAIGEEVPLTLVSNSDYRCAVIDCEEGDIFYLDGLIGGSSARLRIFIDVNNMKLTSCAGSLRSTTETVVAPEGASKFILNDTSMVGVAYKGIPPFYYDDLISKEESDRLNVEFSVYGGVSHPSFIHGSLSTNSDGYVENITYNARCTQDVHKPFSASLGDVINIQEGYRYRVSKATVSADGTKTTNLVDWTSAQTVIKENGLYLAIVQKTDGTVIYPSEAQEAFYITHNGIKTEQSKNGFSLSKNPYRNLTWDVLHDVTSVTHAHCRQADHFATLKSKYEHIAISNYHPSVPYYPLGNYFENTEGLLASPNAEHAHFIGISGQVHLNSLGSFLMSNTDKYDGNVSSMIYDTLNSLKMQSGGGATINHPKWSGLTKEDIIPMIMTGGVIAMEIYNASCEASSNTGYALDIWDDILSDGVQVYGVAVPDHEAQYRPAENRQPFGYNHVLVVNKTEDEILSAYRLGHFYTTLLNDGLTLKNVSISGTGLYSIEVSEESTFTFITATRSVVVSDLSTNLTFQTEDGDLYVRAEAVRENNRLWTNAIFI